MSCTEPGFYDDYGLVVRKSSDLERTFTLPATIDGVETDVTGYTGSLQIRTDWDAASSLLTVSNVATVNGSVIVFAGRYITIRLKRADLETLPENATDSDDPWVGVFDWVNTDTASLTVTFLAGAVTAHRGGNR